MSQKELVGGIKLSQIDLILKGNACLQITTYTNIYGHANFHDEKQSMATGRTHRRNTVEWKIFAVVNLCFFLLLFLGSFPNSENMTK